MGPTPTPTRTLGMRLSCNFVYKRVHDSLSCTVHVHVYTRAFPTDILAKKSARRTKVRGQVGELNGPRADFRATKSVSVSVSNLSFSTLAEGKGNERRTITGYTECRLVYSLDSYGGQRRMSLERRRVFVTSEHICRYGTPCRLTSQLYRRHSRSSESASRHFCFCVHTLTLFCNP